MKTILSAAIGAMLALSAIEAGAQAKAAEKKVELAIEQQSLADALNEWAKQTGLQLVSQSSEKMNTTVAPRIKGEYTAQGALEELLKGTALTYEWVSERAVAIREKPLVVPAALQTSGARERVEVQRLQLANLAAEDERGGGERGEQSGRRSPSEPRKGEEVEELEEIVVTGTHIRGVQNKTVPRMTFTRADIESQGHLSTQDFIRSLPQNFSGGENGASEDGVINSTNGLANVESASGINLRGLGTGSTLVLINGHRVAPAAYGSVVDISMIPLQAIERVDIMTDGASAIYGADAVGGVVNFTLRKDYQGAETSLVADEPTQGGRRHYSVGQTLGASGERGSALVSLQYQDSESLSALDRSFTQEITSPTDLYPSSHQYSGIFNGNFRLADTVNTFADVIYNQEKTARVRTSFGTTEGWRTTADAISANAGVDWQATPSWHIQVSGLYSQLDSVLRQHLTPPQDGFVNGSAYLRNDLALKEFGLKGDGALFSISGGTARAAVGASWREEDFTSRIVPEALDRDFQREVSAAFMEFFVPIVGDANKTRLVRRLELSASVRHEHYDDFGDTTNPKVGVFWAPTNSLSLRASYGSSFHAPTALDEIGNATNLFVFTFPFASPAGGEETILVLSGSPDLDAESSRDLTVGVEFTPESVPGLATSINYYQIDYKDRIVFTPFDTGALLQPDVYGSLITNFGSDAEVASYVDSLVSQGFIFDDFVGGGIEGVRHAYSSAIVNAARVRQRGFDATATYRLTVGENAFQFGINAAVIDQIRTGFCNTCTTTDLVDTYGQPLRSRLRGTVSWERGAWLWNAAVNHAGAYADTTVSPRGRIDAWTTVDLNTFFSPQWLGGTTLGLSIANLFDEDPPLTGGGTIFSGFRYDSSNANPLGRVVALQLRKQW